MRTHFSTNNKPACGRGKRITTVVRSVDCAICATKPVFIAAKTKDDEERKAAFMAQEPRTFSEPWKPGTIECRECGSTEFRIGDRTCYGHYENFHCANCGHVESRLTETGMSS